MKIKGLFFCFLMITLAFSCKKNVKDIYNRDYELLNKKEQNLSSIAENDVNVFLAFANNCPLCKASIPTIENLSKQFPKVGIVLFYPANQRDTQMNDFIEGLLPKKVLQVKDKNKFLTLYFGATVTPEVFVVNKLGNVLYKGSIDDRVSGGWKKRFSNNSPQLLNALDTILNQKKTLKNYENTAVGCYIE